MKNEGSIGISIGQFKVGLPGVFRLALKLQALKDENLYLEEHLATLVKNNRGLQSMRSRKPSLCF